MKRLFVWLMVVQFAFGHNLLTELARVPRLLEHYRQHRHEMPEMSFARFLTLHYFDSRHEHSDRSHDQLPLHQAHFSGAESIIQPHEWPDFQWQIRLNRILQKFTIAEEFLCLPAFLSGVFRPPIV